MTTITYVDAGNDEVSRALNRLGTMSLIRATVRPPARKALRPVVQASRQTAQRTHPLSLRRPPEGSRRGPMSKFVGIANISNRSKLVGARTFFDSKKFAGIGNSIGPRQGFAVMGRRSRKRAFYPAAQELGAAGANPPIEPQRQMELAATSAENRSAQIFADEFDPNFQKVWARANRG